MRPAKSISLNAKDRAYLNQLQGEINAFKSLLGEFDEITAGATDDPFIREVFRDARGRFLVEIEQRRRDWSHWVFGEEQHIALLEV